MICKVNIGSRGHPIYKTHHPSKWLRILSHCHQRLLIHYRDHKCHFCLYNRVYMDVMREVVTIRHKTPSMYQILTLTKLRTFCSNIGVATGHILILKSVRLPTVLYQLKSRLAKILIFRSVEYLKIQGR